MQNPARDGLACAVALCFALCAPAYSAQLPEVEHRATVLVSDFQTPDLPAEKGLVAAETVAAAMEAGGLARAVRPEHAVVQDWGYAFDSAGPMDGRRGGAAGNLDGLPVASTRLKEGSAAPADFRVQGVVSLMGSMWWVKASLSDSTTAEELASSSAGAPGDTGLLEASKAVAAQLEVAYRSKVLEERSEALRRSVVIGDLSRATALRYLEGMCRRWPDALPPPAMGLFLASSASPADPQAVILWGVRTVERLPAAGLAGKRFLLRLGIADPYELLAVAYESAGKPVEAAAVRRKAAEEGFASAAPARGPAAPQPAAANPPPVPDAKANLTPSASQPAK